MTALIDPLKVNALLREVSDVAVMPHFQALEAAEIDFKSGPHDVVTVADKAAEDWLAPRLKDLLPEAAIVGEEAASADETLMEALRRPGLAWLIDPIDGTANFAVGNPLFAVMVSLVQDGEAVQSWIHDPVRRRSVIAEKGAGAWMQENDGPSRRLSLPRPPSLAHIAGAPNLRYGERDFAARIAHRLDKTGGVMILRCAGQEYTAMLEGHFHYAVYNRALPWDHAAGCLAMVEAGGVARRLDGAPYRASDKAFISPLVAACSEDAWQWLKTGVFDP